MQEKNKHNREELSPAYKVEQYKSSQTYYIRNVIWQDVVDVERFKI